MKKITILYLFLFSIIFSLSAENKASSTNTGKLKNSSLTEFNSDKYYFSPKMNVYGEKEVKGAFSATLNSDKDYFWLVYYPADLKGNKFIRDNGENNLTMVLMDKSVKDFPFELTLDNDIFYGVSKYPEKYHMVFELYDSKMNLKARIVSSVINKNKVGSLQHTQTTAQTKQTTAQKTQTTPQKPQQTTQNTKSATTKTNTTASNTQFTTRKVQLPAQQTPAPTCKSKFVRPSIVQYIYPKTIKSGNEEYRMYWVNTNREKDPSNKYIRDIYFVPVGYTPKHSGSGEEQPPRASKVIYHNMGKGDTFLGVLVEELATDQNWYKFEIRLPDEVADMLLDLIENKTTFNVMEGGPLYNMFQSERVERTSSRNLIPRQYLK